MKIGLTTVAYNEQRFIRPFLSHLPSWVDEVVVLVSKTPWNGFHEAQDATSDIARGMGATVVEGDWKTEEAQRNTGQSLLEDCDWVIVLDPDEYLDNENWEKLHLYLQSSSAHAAVVDHQRVFWKDKEVSPCKDYQQLIAVRPSVQFVDKRVVNTGFDVAPIELLHFSWARTDDEVWSKISHYAHASDFSIEEWYETVWLANKTENLHPVTPETLGGLIKPVLPLEILNLELFP